jgi:hypothetical protein
MLYLLTERALGQIAADMGSQRAAQLIAWPVAGVFSHAPMSARIAAL